MRINHELAFNQDIYSHCGYVNHPMCRISLWFQFQSGTVQRTSARWQWNNYSRSCSKNINVNGEIQVQYSGQSAGNATILLQNGTHYVVSDATPTITIKFHFDATRFVGASSISGGIMNLSLNQQSPLFSGAVYNVSVDFFQTKFPGYVSDQFSNYFSIYIENAASVIVAMDGAPF